MFDSSIPSLQSYDTEMRKSIRDKMFFIDHFDADLYIDYGCADGTLFEFLSKVYPDKHFIGYDISREQVDIAQEKFKDHFNIDFSDNWSHVENFIRAWQADGLKVALICNSIIHEIYSYADDDSSINEFWDRVTDMGFDFIAIRDMAVCHDLDDIPPSQEEVEAIRNSYDSGRLAEFENNWGSIKKKKNFVHFLLKYRYVANWDREVKENYLPITTGDVLVNLMKRCKFSEISHFQTFNVPFISKKVEEDFGIEFLDPTHFKLIIKKA